MNRIGLTLITILVAGACTGGVDDPTQTETSLPPGSTTGGSDTTFDHDNDGISPWDLLQRLEVEGPPEYTAHMHSCPKVRYLTLGNLLADRGVNTGNTTAPAGSAAPTAGYLYASGEAALGGENYANRIRENIDITISGESREFDIFAAAAPEVIAAFAANAGSGSGSGSGSAVGIPACPDTSLFDASGVCQPDGITCLIGTPATAAHLSLCNLTVTQASSQEIGEQMAVAALLAAAYTCE